MTFASWSHDFNDVNLLLLTESGDLSNYVYNSEWDMLSMTVNLFSTLTFEENGKEEKFFCNLYRLNEMF